MTCSAAAFRVPVLIDHKVSAIIPSVTVPRNKRFMIRPKWWLRPNVKATWPHRRMATRSGQHRESGKGLEHRCYRGQQWSCSVSGVLSKSRATPQRALARPFCESMALWWAVFLNYIYLSMTRRPHRISGDFNPGVQPRGTPITAEVVHGGSVSINVIWRDAQGRAVTSSWSKSLGWYLPHSNRDDGGAPLDGRDWGVLEIRIVVAYVKYLELRN